MTENTAKVQVKVKPGFNIQEVVSFLEATGAKVIEVAEDVIHAIVSKFSINHVQNHAAVASVVVQPTATTTTPTPVPVPTGPTGQTPPPLPSIINS